MLITFSMPTVAFSTLAIPVKAAQAIEPHVAMAHTWKRDNQARVTLKILGEDRAASTQAHEAFIAELLRQDPRATVKTSRAVYVGLADYEKQTRSIATTNRRAK